MQFIATEVHFGSKKSSIQCVDGIERTIYVLYKTIRIILYTITIKIGIDESYTIEIDEQNSSFSPATFLFSPALVQKA